MNHVASSIWRSKLYDSMCSAFLYTESGALLEKNPAISGRFAWHDAPKWNGAESHTSTSYIVERNLDNGGLYDNNENVKVICISVNTFDAYSRCSWKPKTQHQLRTLASTYRLDYVKWKTLVPNITRHNSFLTVPSCDRFLLSLLAIALTRMRRWKGGACPEVLLSGVSIIYPTIRSDTAFCQELLPSNNGCYRYWGTVSLLPVSLYTDRLLLGDVMVLFMQLLEPT